MMAVTVAATNTSSSSSVGNDVESPGGAAASSLEGAALVYARSRNGTSTTSSSDPAVEWIDEYIRRRETAEETDAASAALGELRARIAHHHTHLVESVARRYLGSGEPLEDLIQEGYLGLLSALDHYDPARGVAASGGRSVKFTTYATHFVAGAIRHFLRDRGKIIKEPAWLHELSGKVNRATDRLTLTLGRAPQSAEIAHELNLTEEAVEEILQTRRTFQVAALSTGSDEDDDGSLAVGLVNPEKIRSDRYETLRLPIEDRIVLSGAMTRLKALEQKVLYEFFYQDMNQTEIARKMDISCNYVSHILKNSTQKLRRILGEADVKERGRAGGRGDAASSVTHPASGLLAPPHARSRIEGELSRAARAGESAALLFVRVGGMPSVGLRRESAWETLGAAVKKTLRRIDVAGHTEPRTAMPGASTVPSDDLVILLPSTTGEQARAVALRLSDMLLAAGAVAGEKLTIAVGVSLYPEEGRALRDLLSCAYAAATDTDATGVSSAASPGSVRRAATAPNRLATAA